MKMKYKILLSFFLIVLGGCDCDKEISSHNRHVTQGIWINLTNSVNNGTKFMIVPGGYIINSKQGYGESMVFVPGKIPELWASNLKRQGIIIKEYEENDKGKQE